MPGLRSDNLAVVAAAAVGCVVYTCLVGMTLWSYLACFLAQPGHVPPGWHPFQDSEVGPALAERAGWMAVWLAVWAHELWAVGLEQLSMLPPRP